MSIELRVLGLADDLPVAIRCYLICVIDICTGSFVPVKVHFAVLVNVVLGNLGVFQRTAKRSNQYGASLLRYYLPQELSLQVDYLAAVFH